MDYIEISLSDMLESIDEDSVKAILSTFSSINKDLESFLIEKSIQFNKQRIAMTHLVVKGDGEDIFLCGYYTIAAKTIKIDGSSEDLSNRTMNRIQKHSELHDDGSYSMAIPLIAQLGKNFAYPDLITGDELLQLACNKVLSAQQLIGGHFTFLECEDVPALLSFYKRNNFTVFDQRDKGDSFFHRLIKYLK